MNIRKLTLIAILLGYFANTCQAAKYYCGDVKSDYNIANLYYSDKTAKQYCRWIKRDFIISDEPFTYTYKQCVDDFNLAKDKYDKGLCTPVIVKNHTYRYQGKYERLRRNYKCKVELIKDTNKVIKTSCEKDSDNGDISEDAMYYFSELYRKKDNKIFKQ